MLLISTEPVHLLIRESALIALVRALAFQSGLVMVLASMILSGIRFSTTPFMTPSFSEAHGDGIDGVGTDGEDLADLVDLADFTILSGIHSTAHQFLVTDTFTEERCLLPETTELIPEADD